MRMFVIIVLLLISIWRLFWGILNIDLDSIIFYATLVAVIWPILSHEKKINYVINYQLKFRSNINRNSVSNKYRGYEDQ